MCVCIAAHTHILKPKSNFYQLFPSFIMSVLSPNPEYAHMALAYTHAQAYVQEYGLPTGFALKIAIDQMPKQDTGEQGNEWLVCKVVYYAHKYREDVTRIVRLLPQEVGKEKYLNCYDLARGETRTPVMECVKEIRVLTLRELLPKVQKYEYLECLILGKTAEQADCDYTAHREVDNAEIQKERDYSLAV